MTASDRPRSPTASDRPRSSWLPDAPPAAPRTIDEALSIAPDLTLAVVGAPAAFAAIEVHTALDRGLDVLVVGEGLRPEDEAAEKAAARARGRLLLAEDALVDGVALAGALPSPPSGSVGLVATDVGGAREAAVVLGRAGFGLSHILCVGARDLEEAIAGEGTLAALARLGADEATSALVVVGAGDARVVRGVQHAAVATGRPAVLVPFQGEARRGVGWETCGSVAEVPRALVRLGVAERQLRVGRRASGAIFATLPSPSLAHEALGVLLGAGLDVASNVPRVGVLPADVGGTTLSCAAADEERARDVRAWGRREEVRVVLASLEGEPASGALAAALEDLAREDLAGQARRTVVIARATPGDATGQALAAAGAIVLPTVGEASRRALSALVGEEEHPRTPLAGRPASILALAADDVAVRLAARGVPVVPVAWSPPAGGDPRLARLVGLLR